MDWSFFAHKTSVFGQKWAFFEQRWTNPKIVRQARKSVRPSKKCPFLRMKCIINRNPVVIATRPYRGPQGWAQVPVIISRSSQKRCIVSRDDLASAEPSPAAAKRQRETARKLPRPRRANFFFEKNTFFPIPPGRPGGASLGLLLARNGEGS